MAGATGLEPVASCVTGRRSTLGGLNSGSGPQMAHKSRRLLRRTAVFGLIGSQSRSFKNCRFWYAWRFFALHPVAAGPRLIPKLIDRILEQTGTQIKDAARTRLRNAKKWILGHYLLFWWTHTEERCRDRATTRCN